MMAAVEDAQSTINVVLPVADGLEGGEVKEKSVESSPSAIRTFLVTIGRRSRNRLWMTLAFLGLGVVVGVIVLAVRGGPSLIATEDVTNAKQTSNSRAPAQLLVELSAPSLPSSSFVAPTTTPPTISPTDSLTAAPTDAPTTSPIGASIPPTSAWSPPDDCIGLPFNTAHIDHDNDPFSAPIHTDYFYASTMPTCLGNLKQLTHLSLTANFMIGSMPTELGRLTALETLQLLENYLTGTIPSQLGALTELKWLGLEYNRLPGTLPTQLGLLTALTGLNFGSSAGPTGTKGTIPTELGLLTALTFLGLSFSRLTGTIPTQLGLLTDLKSLSLSNNQLTGSIPTQLERLTAVEWLYLENNQLN